ncbi:hypothetical protein K8I28_09560 [bacterium]|nr:hypothetical protein [bacterium]
MKNNGFQLWASVLFLVSIITVISCDRGGGGGVGYVEPVEYSIVFGAVRGAVEIEEGTHLTLVVQDENGIPQHNIPFRIRVESDSVMVGYVNHDTVYTDTTNYYGMWPESIFYSSEIGSAELTAIQLSGYGGSVDSVFFGISVLESAYTLEVSVNPDTLITGFPGTIYCKHFYGSQEGQFIPSDGKEIRFRSYELGNPNNSFGVIEPTDRALTNPDDSDGLDGTIQFSSGIPGRGVVEANYYNARGDLVQTAQTIVVVQ